MQWDVPSNSTCSMEVSGLSTSLCCFLLLFWIAFFYVSFRCTWELLELYWPRFRSYEVEKKGDNCSRVNSTVHTLIIIPCLMYGMTSMSWSDAKEAQQSSSFLQATLLISTSYLIFDLYLVLTYRVPMWQLFAFHHVMASVPYLIYYFTCCRYGLFVLALFMMVEITNVPLNAILWMQDTGRIDGLVYPLVLHGTAAMWVVFRVASPLYCLVAMYKYLLPAVNYPKCLWPAQICAVLVNLFCIAGFFGVVMKDIIQYWRHPLKSIAVRQRFQEAELQH